MAESKLVRGTMMLTGATLFSRLLGLLYIFPFTLMVGQQGNALYSYGYLPYTLLLSLSTLGIPMAVSKFVAKYHAVGDYETGHRLFRSALIVMGITGVISFLLLFLLAPQIAAQVVADDGTGNRPEDATFVIRMVSVALIIIPIMAVIRGYFQGFQSMGPTAISQVVEQIFRVGFILVATFLILQVGNGSLGTAVGFATFGAFIGGLGSFLVLYYFWRKRKAGIHQLVSETKRQGEPLPLGGMYKELIRYALPLSFVGLAIPLYQLIDMFTYSSALETYGFTGQEAESAFGIFARTSHSVILIPVAVATAMSVNIIPAITRSNTSGNRDEMNAYMTKCFYIILFFTVPAMAGLMILSTPAFATLFGMDDYILGGQILQMYAPAAVLFSLFAVTAAMLQGMNKQKQAIMGLVIGLVIKLSLTYILTVLFGVGGAIVATLLGYSTAIVYNVVSIRKATNYEVNQLKRPALKVALITIVMVVAVAIVQAGGQHVFDASTQLGMVSILAFGVVTGGLLYFVLAVRTGLAADVLGDRFTLLRK
ncbi:putative polysaccharide biosynthesis protein [Geomicrobium sediminis]|uniref:O-antigen/teichoic acid export membrane protein n=1 Tax=Geomicrobium sediminis TaxID=1347788 RepID=A0ABS2P920_9BACL|nr:polysaccharide biosynthesis protein [Geomicrobium sediminis]MBM7631890.1 O-antigen/teichoic acid export membrane protein [Geomicrobium sediminis]